MGERTGIAWTDHTFNPWWGCAKVSEGCRNCYAKALAERSGHGGLWGPRTARRSFADGHWSDPLRWNRKAERGGVRRRVFCGSMCDVFEDHPDLPHPRQRLFDLVEATPWLDWLVLTKRPENVNAMLPVRWTTGGLPRNLWFGISAHDQESLYATWPILDGETHHLDPSILFLSLEPLLGPVNLEDLFQEIDVGDEDHSWWTRSPDWVIVGGESQVGFRPMDLGWVRLVLHLCREREVPCFVKQLGGWPDKGTDPNSWPEDIRVQEFPIG